ncbi:hydroxyphenylacetyl-CoA thioesterase PaaI [Halocalculus aciditolerans]|nr:hydroxyphenylacetyl-CoA thioesterase PaaI [Halocalculus aciditolerans]
MTANNVDADTKERIESDPYCDRIGIEVVELKPRAARVELTLEQSHCNFHGTPHGGVIYSLADAAFAAASNASGETAVALETNISYLDTVDVGTTITATATEEHDTTRTGTYEVQVKGGDDVLAIFRGRVYRP